MATEAKLRSSLQIVVGDLDVRTYERLSTSPVLSWDIETTGLDWRIEQIATVQIHDRGSVTLVQHLNEHPERLCLLLEASDTPKLLHHAMFDLRFMAAKWGAYATNVACTKVAAKLLRSGEQSLAPLVRRYLGVVIDKTRQTSDWMSASLSEDQLEYAAGDVWYLEELMARLRDELESRGQWELAEACFAHLPTRVALDINEFDDVYGY